jgi:quercetin dioxygenase-like cupin family protein
MPDVSYEYLSDMRVHFAKLRTMADRAMAQVGDDDFARMLDAENNSIAIIVKHITGNLRSRCTDFLTSDGEKPDRDRDGEFVLQPGDTRLHLLDEWAAAWDLLAATVEALTPEDVHRTIYIRAEAHTVGQALTRHLGHLSYHVGQIVLLARHWVGSEWRTLSIPRGKSRTFTPAKQEQPATDASRMPMEHPRSSSPPAIVVIPPHAGRAVEAFGSSAVFKLEGRNTGGALSLGIAQTPPGDGPPPHVHRRDDEVFVVLEGELSFQTAAGWVAAPQGTVVYAPRGAPHTFRNAGASPSRHLVLTLPSGFEDFYVRCGELFAAGGPPDIGKLRALADEYGYEFLAPGSLPAGSGSSSGEHTA